MRRVFTISRLESVGFFTLLEQKIIGFAHNRKGPNKVGYMGILQAIRTSTYCMW